MFGIDFLWETLIIITSTEGSIELMDEAKKTGTKNEFSEQCKDFDYIAKKMKEIRQLNEKSREEMAKALNVSKAYIEKIETSKVKIPAYAVWKYSEVLGFTIESFFPDTRLDNARRQISRRLAGLDETVLSCLWSIIQTYEKANKNIDHIYEEPQESLKVYLREIIDKHLRHLDINILRCLWDTIKAFKKEEGKIVDEIESQQKPRTQGNKW